MRPLKATENKAVLVNSAKPNFAVVFVLQGAVVLKTAKMSSSVTLATRKAFCVRLERAGRSMVHTIPNLRKQSECVKKHYPLVWYLTLLFAEGEVDTSEYSPRRSRGEYSLMFTEPEENSFFSIIFRAEYRGLQKHGLKHKNT